MLSDANLISKGLTCHICGAQNLDLLSSYPQLPRVASDCVPWRSGGRLGTCHTCLCVQNPVDKYWRAETAEIYGQYKIYCQSAGSEQGVFAGGSALIPRSMKIFQQAAAYLDLQKPGRLLDVGCANGELLRYFGSIAPDWKMAGFEIDDKRRKEVESIRNVETFASGSLNKIEQKFDLITLIHVLEHLPDPAAWLKAFHNMLTPEGIVLIQVPDPKKNPYNLLVADHCSHFIMPDLINVAKQAGYEVVVSSDQWVAREFTLLIKPAKTGSLDKVDYAKSIGERTATYPENAVQWLSEIIRLANNLPQTAKKGIWGTAIAATWLYSIMDVKADFFVDEDPHRIGQTHLGHPIFSPDRAPNDSHIFIALTPEIAANIQKRWSHLPVTLHIPPALTY